MTERIESSTGDINPISKKVASIAEGNNRRFEQLGTLVSNTSSERKKIQSVSCKRFEEEFCKENHEVISEIRELEIDYQLLFDEKAELKRIYGDTASARDRVVTTFSALLERFFGNKYTFDGTTFKVRRNNRQMRRGSDRTLSDGEKAALAFCYFLAQTHLKGGVGLVWKIQVIDLVRFWCRDERPKTAIRDNGPLQGRILSRRQGRAGEGGNAPHRQKRYDAVS